MKQKKVYEVKDESLVEISVSSGWVLKSTPFIVCDIFLERYVTAGVLSEPQIAKSSKVLNFKMIFLRQIFELFQPYFHSSCISNLVSIKIRQHQFFIPLTVQCFYLLFLEQLWRKRGLDCMHQLLPLRSFMWQDL